jgi:hypothetical protein
MWHAVYVYTGECEEGKLSTCFGCRDPLKRQRFIVALSNDDMHGTQFMHTRCYEATAHVFMPQAKECHCCTSPVTVDNGDLRAHVVAPFGHYNEIWCASCALYHLHNAELTLTALKREALNMIRGRCTDIMSAESKSLDMYCDRQKTLKNLMKELEGSFSKTPKPLKRPIEEIVSEVDKLDNTTQCEPECGCGAHIAKKFTGDLQDKFTVIWRIAGIIGQYREWHDARLIATLKKQEMDECHKELMETYWHPSRYEKWRYNE